MKSTVYVKADLACIIEGHGYSSQEMQWCFYNYKENNCILIMILEVFFGPKIVKIIKATYI